MDIPEFYILGEINDDYYNVEIDTPISNMMSFPIKSYINDLLGSYHYDVKKIYEQLEVDYPRIDVYINNIKINDINQFRNHISEYYNTLYFINNKFYRYSVILSLLPNQSSFYLPYVCVYKVYQKGEYVVTSSSHNRRVEFDFINHRIYVMSEYIIKSKYTDKKVNVVSTKLLLELDDKNILRKEAVLLID